MDFTEAATLPQPCGVFVSSVASPRIIEQDPERVGQWMAARGAAVYRPGSACIGLERRGELVAGTLYDYCNGASVFANIAIAGPITKTWLWYIFYYPFVQLGVNTLIGLIEPQNVKSQQLATHFGFTELTGIPDGAPHGDLLMYVMQREQCRFLKGRYV